ncbi:hypothetical protein C4D60_Mb02t02740 [Musa balbisiana]|uniref:Uncharacterized protein n=1 Tax=Musa balbisiana TaxID=52838 RepID=A0A4S8I7S0_MUSBA|nr:hypothetical protein C4D60_Mb02t02740 [Musa balbisiana]
MPNPWPNSRMRCRVAASPVRFISVQEKPHSSKFLQGAPLLYDVRALCNASLELPWGPKVSERNLQPRLFDLVSVPGNLESIHCFLCQSGEFVKSQDFLEACDLEAGNYLKIRGSTKPQTRLKVWIFAGQMGRREWIFAIQADLI